MSTYQSTGEIIAPPSPLIAHPRLQISGCPNLKITCDPWLWRPGTKLSQLLHCVTFFNRKVFVFPPVYYRYQLRCFQAKMQPNAGYYGDDNVPRYEAWPSVSTKPLPTYDSNGESIAMEVDSVKPGNGRGSRDTSILSMDDLEAAQALEGLRAGRYTHKS